LGITSTHSYPGQGGWGWPKTLLVLITTAADPIGKESGRARGICLLICSFAAPTHGMGTAGAHDRKGRVRKRMSCGFPARTDTEMLRWGVWTGSQTIRCLRERMTETQRHLLPSIPHWCMLGPCVPCARHHSEQDRLVPPPRLAVSASEIN
jgi:hypothetical protein